MKLNVDVDELAKYRDQAPCWKLPDSLKDIMKQRITEEDVVGDCAHAIILSKSIEVNNRHLTIPLHEAFPHSTGTNINTGEGVVMFPNKTIIVPPAGVEGPIQEIIKF
jgi:hypothetical protein